MALSRKKLSFMGQKYRETNFSEKIGIKSLSLTIRCMSNRLPENYVYLIQYKWLRNRLSRFSTLPLEDLKIHGETGGIRHRQRI